MGSVLSVGFQLRALRMSSQSRPYGSSEYATGTLNLLRGLRSETPLLHGVAIILYTGDRSPTAFLYSITYQSIHSCCAPHHYIPVISTA
jgi:hypothetical protein